jgi:hypothetical protein
MKTGDAFSVPLSERAVAILADARRMARKEPTPESFVFLGARPRQPLSSMALAMLMRRMGRRDAARVSNKLQDVGERCRPHAV